MPTRCRKLLRSPANYWHRQCSRPAIWLTISFLYLLTDHTFPNRRRCKYNKPACMSPPKPVRSRYPERNRRESRYTSAFVRRLRRKHSNRRTCRYTLYNCAQVPFLHCLRPSKRNSKEYWKLHIAFVFRSNKNSNHCSCNRCKERDSACMCTVHMFWASGLYHPAPHSPKVPHNNYELSLRRDRTPSNWCKYRSTSCSRVREAPVLHCRRPSWNTR